MKTIKQEEFKVLIEEGIDFTREEYEQKSATRKGLVPFDDFIDSVAQSCYDNNGTIDDAVYIANDAYEQL